MAASISKMYRSMLFAAAALLSSVQANAADEKSVRIVTTQLPPYVIADNNQLSGVAVEIIAAMSKASNYTKKPEVLPWLRAQAETQENGANTLIFPLSRTPEREPLYRWIGMLFADNLVAVRKTSSPTISRLNDCRKIGVLNGGPGMAILAKTGLDKITETVKEEAVNLKKLDADRIDCWVSGELIMHHLVKEAKLDIKQFKEIEVLSKIELNLAATRDISDAEANKWGFALENLKKTGAINDMVAKYRLK